MPPIATAVAAMQRRPLSADCVAKLFAVLRERNNRICPNNALNQYSSFAPSLNPFGKPPENHHTIAARVTS
jgi:hypothetical protein